MHTMLTQIANQLRTAATPAPALAPPRPRVVAVVGLHHGSAAAEVAAAIVARLSTHLSVVAPGRVDAAGLARAESDHDRVVLVADGSSADARDVEWRSFCRRQSDVVVLVSRADGDLPTDLVALENQRELVLMGPQASPAERAAWVAATDAWQLTSVDGDLATGVRALADRLAGRSLGLVLAGGGARAFAHIGILSELEAAGFHVDRVAGSSIGAVVAAMYAQGWDAHQVEDTMYAEFVRRNPFSDWTLPRHSLARGARQRSVATRTYGADSVIEGLPRQLHVVSTDLITRQRVVHSRGSLGLAVTASSRLPILFPPIPTEAGQLLIDGGVLDNLPVDVLLQRDEGPVVAVNISMGGGPRGSTRVGKPRVPAVGDTLLRTMMIGAGGAVKAAHQLGVPVVTPATMGVGLLEFHQFDVMVRAGREAARALLEQGTLSVVPPVDRAAVAPPHHEETPTVVAGASG
jgi:NTE family protein